MHNIQIFKDLGWTFYIFLMFVLTWTTITTTVDSYTADFLYKNERPSLEVMRKPMDSLAQVFALLAAFMWAIWVVYYL
jgi:hypothetical protein